MPNIGKYARSNNMTNSDKRIMQKNRQLEWPQDSPLAQTVDLNKQDQQRGPGSPGQMNLANVLFSYPDEDNKPNQAR